MKDNKLQILIQIYVYVSHPKKQDKTKQYSELSDKYGLLFFYIKQALYKPEYS